MPDVDERARRLRSFCEAYHLMDRTGLIDAVRARAIFIAKFMEDQARLGDPGFTTLVDRGTPRRMVEEDVRYLDEHRDVFERALA